MAIQGCSSFVQVVCHDTTLLHCRHLIEEKLGWGNSDGWTTQHFERLSDQIAGETGALLSVTTLKRVWGRVKYNSVPTTTTLNVLALFVGFPTWLDFQQSRNNRTPIQEEAPSESRADALTTPRFSIRFRWQVWVALGVGLLIVLAFVRKRDGVEHLSPADFSFSSQPVTEGIPNSVVFRYNATAAPSDSVFIQQSWDTRRRQWVPRDGHEHTSIYYYPGYFRAKLVVDGQVVREHDLHILSQGWVVAVHQEPVPVYFSQAETIRNGILSLSEETMRGQNIAMQPTLPHIRYRNVPMLKGLRNDNFVFETRIRNDFRQGSAVCQRTQIVLLCQNDVFLIPLCAKGCVGDLSLFLAGHLASSTHTDLSAFGCDLSQWVDVRCEVRNKRVRLWINGKQAYEAEFPNEASPLVGVSYDIEGTGSVDWVRFARLNGQVVYEDTFDAQ
jgi:hypothetical protein